ncbi:MAG: UTP--glucose-1-phosphate uridylyltransferase [Clostridia bacterium]|nr:UTP--glucose-1-phosphate uridylyltransferase [Clostridia bacterium]
MKRITKAIIPAAGLGTRMLPISAAVCKEMLPIVDIPAICHLVEEAAACGITDILIITNRGKEIMENFFDLSPEYEAALAAKAKYDEIDRLREIANTANVYFLRQKETLGLGHAVGRARSFIGDDPFIVMYGDDVIFSDRPVCGQMMDVYEKYGRPVVAVKPVSPEELSKYSSLKVEPIEGEDRVTYCTDMIEKPKAGEEFSNLSILGRVLLTPDIFDIIDELDPGAGGEYQLTDAIKQIARESGIYALEFEGDRYDLGSKIGFLKANIVKGLEHPETGGELKAFIKKIAEEI